MRRIALLLGVLAIAGCFGPNHYEQQADAVTKAIVANDMRPVEKDFNALVRPKLESHARVGALSDQLAALGTFKGVKEDTPADAPPRAHKFNATFEHATWIECMTYDTDGKIASFDVLPPGHHCPRM
ncbi:MAG: hypothetical protein JO060_07675 [Candidatus Eremiobacteraeota bacterium]|nr:hypothetical protein [Candidatus Eremiobacteraeota bacterium]MBV9647068.1 hypothetical protein [Candidatus Eremiobacteraeota bacterium]